VPAFENTVLRGLAGGNTANQPQKQSFISRKVFTFTTKATPCRWPPTLPATRQSLAVFLTPAQKAK